MKRFLIFVSSQYYPCGASDLDSDADTLEEAKEICKKHKEKEGGYSYEFTDIIDTQARSVDEAIIH